MAGRLEGKVALVSGAARGQGRSHAVRLAQEGADIIAFDVCRQLDTVPYPLAVPEDLKETVRLVEDLDRRIVAREADVRDSAAVQARGRRGRAPSSAGSTWSAPTPASARSPRTPGRCTDEHWEEMIEVNLTGVFKTVKAARPGHDRGRQRRLDRDHQLDRRAQGHGRHRALRTRPSTAWSG